MCYHELIHGAQSITVIIIIMNRDTMGHQLMDIRVYKYTTIQEYYNNIKQTKISGHLCPLREKYDDYNKHNNNTMGLEYHTQ